MALREPGAQHTLCYANQAPQSPFAPCTSAKGTGSFVRGEGVPQSGEVEFLLDLTLSKLYNIAQNNVPSSLKDEHTVSNEWLGAILTVQTPNRRKSTWHRPPCTEAARCVHVAAAPRAVIN